MTIKTVHIIALHLAIGGAERAVSELANALCEYYSVELSLVYPMVSYDLDERVKTEFLLTETPNREEWRNSVKRRDIPSFIRESARAVRILVKKRIAVIKKIRSIRSGAIITTRNEHNILLSKYGRKGVRRLAQMHHDHAFSKKYIRAFRHCYGNIDVFALLTNTLAEETASFLGGETKAAVIPNFLDSFPKNIEISGRNNTIVAVGRLVEVKGFDRLISAFSLVHERCPEPELVILGEGPERDKLEKLVRSLGLEGSVSLPGELSPEAVEEKMKSSLICTVSSHSEGLPFAVLEAMSCALPVVAYDVRVGTRELVKDGENGFLISDGDETAFADAVCQLAENEQLRQKLAKGALASAQKYGKEKVLPLWIDAIEGRI